MYISRFWKGFGLILLSALLFGVLLSACGPVDDATPGGASSLMVPQNQEVALEPVALNQPLVVDRNISFLGEIHCDACSEQGMTVTLRSDYRYLLKIVAADPATEIVLQLGHWQQTMENGQQKIKLLGTPYQFVVTPAHQLQLVAPITLMTDTQKKQRVLVQTSHHLHTEPLPIFAVYQYLADAAILQECGSGLRLSVVPQGDSFALEQAYLAAVETPGQPLVVALQASIVATPEQEGSNERWLVNSFDALTALSSCESKLAEPTATHTYWKLLSIDGQPIETPENRREVHFVLGADGRVHGFAGCNQFFAQYELSGKQLQIDRIGGTKMACPEGMGAEKAFLAALGVIDGFEIEGQTMMLLQNDLPLMEFEAVYLY